MIFPEKKVTLRDGRTCVLRSAVPADAEEMRAYLTATSAETPFLLRGPQDDVPNTDEERAFLQSCLDQPRGQMQTIRVDGTLAGSCRLSPEGSVTRSRHRCGVAIALYQTYCGLGIGRYALETLIEAAKRIGYEQMELSVVRGNGRAQHLYERLGFQAYGLLPHAMKYPDGSYADEILMIKSL